MKRNSITSSFEPAPRRLLLVRLSAIGDIVFASPLLEALHRRWPEAQISWLVQEDYQSLLQSHPKLHQIIPVPVSHWKQLGRERQFLALFRSVRDFRTGLRAEGFDLVLDLQGLLKSGLLAWFSGAETRIGLGAREGSQWLMTHRLPRGGDSDWIASEYRYLAEQLGLPLEDFSLSIHPSPEDQAFAQALIQQEGLEDGYALFCPFTTRTQKHWLEDRWAALAAGVQSLGLPVLLLGGPGDRAAAARLCARAPQLRNWVGKTRLGEAAALTQRSRLVIAVDTGLGHLGIAFRRPTLLLFGATCPYRHTGTDRARVLYHPLPCSPCKRRPSCGGRFDCMRAISVSEVLAAARQLL